MGIMLIIGDALSAITIVAILVAWLSIWIGVLLMPSARVLEHAQLSGDITAMKEGLSK